MKSDEKIIEEMIAFVIKEEKRLQESKTISSNQIKNDVVASVLKKLDEEVSNEDKEY